MPFTPSTPAPISRYYQVGKIKWYWVPSISNQAAPTGGELSAGTDITRDVQGFEGWRVATDMIKTPDVNSRFTGQIPGRIDAEKSSITIYEDQGQSDLRTLMPKDTSGYIVVANGGVAGGKADVFKVTVSAVPKLRSTSEAAMLKFEFAITAEPSENVTLP